MEFVNIFLVICIISHCPFKSGANLVNANLKKTTQVLIAMVAVTLQTFPNIKTQSQSEFQYKIGVQSRDQREFSIPGILARISFIFSRSAMTFHFVILVPFSKLEILKEKIPFSSRTPRFIRQKSCLVSNLEI